MHSGQWFMRRFLKIYQNFPYFAPFWAPKGPAPLIEQIWILFSQASFLPSLVEIGLVVLEKKSFKRKCWRRMDAAPYHKLSWPLARWGKDEGVCLVTLKYNKWSLPNHFFFLIVFSGWLLFCLILNCGWLFQIKFYCIGGGSWKKMPPDPTMWLILE